jgi:hypothetical protein
MKRNHYRIAFLVCPLIASTLLSSCVYPGYDLGRRDSSGDSRYDVYPSLPDSYVGSAYYYNGRYYSGGTYETGRFFYGGKPYTSRYYHNGQYLYGGRYMTYDSNRSYYGRDTNYSIRGSRPY